jgi:hypothetical protein
MCAATSGGAALRADGRRHAISAATAGELGTLDELPQNPLSGAYQSRQPRHPRRHKGQSFGEFVDSTVERWVTNDMAAADSDFRSGLAKITNAAEAKARAAAEQTEDGHVDIDMPKSFQEKYDDAVAQLDNANGTERLKVQRAMFLAEAGGKPPDHPLEPNRAGRQLKTSAGGSAPRRRRPGRRRSVTWHPAAAARPAP